MRIKKVQDGWKKGFYTDEEANSKLSEHRETIAMAEAEIHRLRADTKGRGLGPTQIELLRQRLTSLRERNLQESTFEEKVDLVARLGIKVRPSEDLKSRKISCRLNLLHVAGEGELSDFAKAVFGGPSGIRTVYIPLLPPTPPPHLLQWHTIRPWSPAFLGLSGKTINRFTNY